MFSTSSIIYPYFLMSLAGVVLEIVGNAKRKKKKNFMALIGVECENVAGLRV